MVVHSGFGIFNNCSGSPYRAPVGLLFLARILNVHVSPEPRPVDARKAYIARTVSRRMSAHSSFVSLSCIRCRTEHPLNTQGRCTKCGGLLTSRYNVAAVDHLRGYGEGIWRYSVLLPPVSEENRVSLGEGATPCIRAKNIEPTGASLLLKLEGANPTGSFKDRGAALGISLAKDFGYSDVFTASSGNAAAAISAYAARGGLGCTVLARPDAGPSKLMQTASYGATVYMVKGLFSDASGLLASLERASCILGNAMNLFIWAPVNPLILEGFKSIAYELVQDAPEYVFVPTAGGDLAYALYKGFEELAELGAIRSIPRIVVVQGEGADPTVRAIGHGDEMVEEIPDASTVASALRVSFGAEHALIAARKSGGFGVSVNDQAIVDAQKLLARKEGVFCEVSSAASVAAFIKCVNEGTIDRGESVAALLTGSGFKEPPVLDAAFPLVEGVDKIRTNQPSKPC